MRDRTYKMRIRQNNNGQALLVLGEGNGGYLWIPQTAGKIKDPGIQCHGWIDQRQLDAIAKVWCRHRGIKP